jgi:hypothetical protein
VLAIFWLFGLMLEVLIVKNKNVQENFIVKLSSVRSLINSRLTLIDSRHLLELMGKLAHYHYNKKKSILLGIERDLYNLLISEGYNPFTVYRWLLLEKIPDDLKFKLKQKEITQKKAVALAFERRGEGVKELTQSVRILGLNIISRI